MSSKLGVLLGVCLTALPLYARDTSGRHDALARSQKILTDAMKANAVRSRVAAENMANSKSADYVPKSIHMGVSHDRASNTTSVQVKKIIRDPKRMERQYDPSHPMADAKGMVNMPKLDPLMTMMDMQNAKLDTERAMKSYQMTTDMRHRTIKMIN